MPAAVAQRRAARALPRVGSDDDGLRSHRHRPEVLREARPVICALRPSARISGGAPGPPKRIKTWEESEKTQPPKDGVMMAIMATFPAGATVESTTPTLRSYWRWC